MTAATPPTARPRLTVHGLSACGFRAAAAGAPHPGAAPAGGWAAAGAGAGGSEGEPAGAGFAAPHPGAAAGAGYAGSGAVTGAGPAAASRPDSLAGCWRSPGYWSFMVVLLPGKRMLDVFPLACSGMLCRACEVRQPCL